MAAPPPSGPPPGSQPQQKSRLAFYLEPITMPDGSALHAYPSESEPPVATASALAASGDSVFNPAPGPRSQLLIFPKQAETLAADATLEKISSESGATVQLTGLGLAAAAASSGAMSGAGAGSAQADGLPQLRSVRMAGSEDQMRQARQELASTLDLDWKRQVGEQPMQLVAAVPKDILGQGLEPIQQITRASGADIAVTPEEDCASVTFTGLPSQVIEAQAQIASLTDGALADPSLVAAEPEGVVLHIPTRDIYTVIGEDGSRAGEIQHRSGVRLDVAPQTSGSSTRPLTIWGTRPQITMAHGMIKQKLSGGNNSSGNAHAQQTPSASSPPAASSLSSSQPQPPAGLPLDATAAYAPASLLSDPWSAAFAAPRVETSMWESWPDVTQQPMVDGNSAAAAAAAAAAVAAAANAAAGMAVGLPEHTINKIIRVPNELVGLLIGRNGSSVRQLQEQSGATVQIPKEPTPGVDYREITITGNSYQVSQCEGLIFERVTPRMSMAGDEAGPQSLTSISVRVPEGKVGLVVGKRGATIRQLQEQSGARIFVPPEQTSEDGEAKEIRIQGSPAQVIFAEQLVLNCLTPREQPDLGHSAQVAVPNELVGLLIGTGGVHVRRLEDECHVKLEIPKANPEGSDEPRQITIRGLAENVTRCEKRISDLLKSVEEQAQAASTYPSVQMKVPNSRVGIIIGKNGSTVKHLQDDSGAIIKIPKEVDEDSEFREITLTGPPEAVEYLQKRLQPLISLEAPADGASVDGLPVRKVKLVSVPSELVGLIIGRQGSTIRQIQAKSNCKISVPAPVPGADSRELEVTGFSEEDLERCEELLLECVKSAEGKPVPPPSRANAPGTETLRVRVPSSKVGLIIGRGGQTIRSLTNATGALIEISKSGLAGQPFREVLVTGTPEANKRCELLIYQTIAPWPEQPRQTQSQGNSPAAAAAAAMGFHPAAAAAAAAAMGMGFGFGGPAPGFGGGFGPGPSMFAQPQPDVYAMAAASGNAAFWRSPAQMTMLPEIAATLVLDFAPAAPPALVGDNTAALRQLQEQTGAHVVGAAADGASQTLTLSGRDSQMAFCLAMLQQFNCFAEAPNEADAAAAAAASAGAAPALNPPTTLTMQLPLPYLPFVAGRSGELLQELQAQSGASVSLQPAAGTTAMVQPLVVAGSLAAVHTALQIVGQRVHMAQQQHHQQQQQEQQLQAMGASMHAMALNSQAQMQQAFGAATQQQFSQQQQQQMQMQGAGSAAGQGSRRGGLQGHQQRPSRGTHAGRGRQGGRGGAAAPGKAAGGGASAGAVPAAQQPVASLASESAFPPLSSAAVPAAAQE